MHADPSQLDLRRVNVVGVSGSGKSTFARQLADLLASDYIELDQIYWGKNWTEPTPEDFTQRVTTALRPDSWVADGNYHSKTYSVKRRRATAFIWLDISFGRTMLRSVNRAMQRAWSQEELWPGTGIARRFASRC